MPGGHRGEDTSSATTWLHLRTALARRGGRVMIAHCSQDVILQ